MRGLGDSGLAGRCASVTVLADGASIDTGLVVPQRKRPGRALLLGEEEDNAEHRKVRARYDAGDVPFLLDTIVDTWAEAHAVHSDVGDRGHPRRPAPPENPTLAPCVTAGGIPARK